MKKEDKYKPGQRWVFQSNFILQIISLEPYVYSSDPENSCYCEALKHNSYISWWLMDDKKLSWWLMDDKKLLKNQDALNE